ncbi:ParB/RepB/Spo0J family partition protein [Brucella intermedia]|uniref:ParB/RepB/Spo0J family partition protein n=1 Tax=Brucella TaxID=234 RepID=UPI0009467836|nr:ParB/RepB/Spo0J family partition protein [Brucella intermedia]
MHLMKVDPRALKENPDRSRHTISTPQADALLLSTIKAVGIVQPPIIAAEKDGGNGYVINAGHRRVKQAIAAGLEEIDVLVAEGANDHGAMRSMIENMAREPLNPVDLWRAIERLIALDWTEEAIAVALGQPVRQIRKLRLLANVLPAMLDRMARGDMPNEQQLRTIAAASVEEQKEVWKANKPKKNEAASWWSIANSLNRKRLYAKDASFGDDLAAAYGIEWVEDLFAPADEDTRYTTNVDAFLGAQHEWMTANMPKRCSIVEINSWGQPELPKKAERIYGKPQKSDQTAMFLDREGKVQTVHFRMPEVKKPKGKTGNHDAEGVSLTGDDPVVVAKTRPDVTQKGYEMIGNFRTDALQEALRHAPIEDDMLMALLILAFASQNVRVDLANGNTTYGRQELLRHAVDLFDENGKFSFDMNILRATARKMLADVFSCRRGPSNSGIVSRIAGEAIGADAYLPNMGGEDFMLCLSRQALEAACKDTSVLPRPRVRETRAALIEHFKSGHFVHPAALFAPNSQDVSDWLSSGAVLQGDDVSIADEDALEGVASNPDDMSGADASVEEQDDPAASMAQSPEDDASGADDYEIAA